MGQPVRDSLLLFYLRSGFGADSFFLSFFLSLFLIHVDHSAMSHQQYPSAYSQYNDPYAQIQAQTQGTTFNADQYNRSATIPMPSTSPVQHTTSPPPRQPSASQYYNQPASAQQQGQGYDYDYDYYGYGKVGEPTAQPQAQGQAHQVERSYTLGGGGYGGNTVPDSYGNVLHVDTDVNVNVGMGGPLSAGAGAGGDRKMASEGYGYHPDVSGAGVGMPSAQPQPQPQQQQQQTHQYEDSPPGYDAGSSQPGNWDTKTPRS